MDDGRGETIDVAHSSSGPGCQTLNLETGGSNPPCAAVGKAYSVLGINVAHSSSGSGCWIFTPEIGGSNPSCATFLCEWTASSIGESTSPTTRGFGVRVPGCLPGVRCQVSGVRCQVDCLGWSRIGVAGAVCKTVAFDDASGFKSRTTRLCEGSELPSVLRRRSSIGVVVIVG